MKLCEASGRLKRSPTAIWWATLTRTRASRNQIPSRKPS